MSKFKFGYSSTIQVPVGGYLNGVGRTEAGDAGADDGHADGHGRSVDAVSFVVPGALLMRRLVRSHIRVAQQLAHKFETRQEKLPHQIPAWRPKENDNTITMNFIPPIKTLLITPSQKIHLSVKEGGKTRTSVILIRAQFSSTFEVQSFHVKSKINETVEYQSKDNTNEKIMFNVKFGTAIPMMFYKHFEPFGNWKVYIGKSYVTYFLGYLRPCTCKDNDLFSITLIQVLRYNLNVGTANLTIVWLESNRHQF